MKKAFVLLALVFCLIFTMYSCFGGGELEKRTDTSENNRVIGAQTSTAPKSSAPSSSSAPAQSSSDVAVSSSQPPQSSAPAVTQQSGTVRDDQEAAFRLRLEWNTSTENGNLIVDTKLYIDCYSLTVNSQKNGFITVNGEKRSFTTSGINETENALHSICVAEETFTVAPEDVPAGGIAVQAQWDFNGKYSQQQIDSLTLSETIIIGG